MQERGRGRHQCSDSIVPMAPQTTPTTTSVERANSSLCDNGGALLLRGRSASDCCAEPVAASPCSPRTSGMRSCIVISAGAM
eukprot:scaffold129800_cov35-Tisochrysis_lutea.AAC.2